MIKKIELFTWNEKRHEVTEGRAFWAVFPLDDLPVQALYVITGDSYDILQLRWDLAKGDVIEKGLREPDSVSLMSTAEQAEQKAASNGNAGDRKRLMESLAIELNAVVGIPIENRSQNSEEINQAKSGLENF